MSLAEEQVVPRDHPEFMTLGRRLVPYSNGSTCDTTRLRCPKNGGGDDQIAQLTHVRNRITVSQCFFSFQIKLVNMGGRGVKPR